MELFSEDYIICRLAAFLSYFVIELAFPSLIQLIIGIAVFLSSFMGLIVITIAINKTDIINLKEMTTGGALGKIINASLTMIENLGFKHGT